MASHRQAFDVNRIADNYANLRTVPALLGIIFAASTLFQFNGVSPPELLWFDYTLTTTHAVGASLVVYLVAFMSSETRQWENYSSSEKAVIALGPLLILGEHFDPLSIVSALLELHDPGAYIVAFVIVLASYGTAIR